MLVAAARSGDQDAFAALHARFERLVHGILLARVPFAEIDDLVQEAFLQAWKRLSSLRDPASFGAWMATIARNLAHDFHRHKLHLVLLTDRHAAREPVDPSVFRILETIRALPDAYRETLLLRLVEGLTGPEIAEQTGLTPDSVRVNLHRGMKMLRSRLEGGSQ